jgi:hypothetical protein
VLFLALVFGLDGGKEFGVGLFDKNIAVVHGSPFALESLEKKQGLPRRTAETLQGVLPQRYASQWLAGACLLDFHLSGSTFAGCCAYRQSRTFLV